MGACFTVLNSTLSVFVLGQMPGRLLTALKVLGTSLFALLVLGGILAAYVTGYQFIHTDRHHLSFGLYGAILGLHLLTQSLFAYLEHRRMRKGRQKFPTGNSRVALCIAAYQEDPEYLRKCLQSVRRLSYPHLRVVMVVDGNTEDDRYMMDIFREVMGSEGTCCYMWDNNYHVTEEGGQEGERGVEELVQKFPNTCIMQKWGGKREVMYTAFRALGDSVDYVQVRAMMWHCYIVGN